MLPFLVHVQAISEVKEMTRFWYSVDRKIERRFEWSIRLPKDIKNTFDVILPCYHTDSITRLSKPNSCTSQYVQKDVP